MIHPVNLVSGLFAMALSAGSAANVATERVEPVFIEGGQYGAVLDQEAKRWRLLPGDGIDLVVTATDPSCAGSSRLPTGIWLVTEDGAGHPVLSAPSITPLPASHPEQVALRLCGERGDGSPHLAVPQGMLDWLTANTGAIYVED